MEFSRQEYWSELPCPTPGDLPNPGKELRFPILKVASLPFEPPGKPKNTGVGSLSLLQGVVLISRSTLTSPKQNSRFSSPTLAPEFPIYSTGTRITLLNFNSGKHICFFFFSLERGLGIALQERQEKKAVTSRGRGHLRVFLELRRPWEIGRASCRERV